MVNHSGEFTVIDWGETSRELVGPLGYYHSLGFAEGSEWFEYLKDKDDYDERQRTEKASSKPAD